jgi:hypothetical protein
VCRAAFSRLKAQREVRMVRLLDHVAQSTDPVLVRERSGELWQLTGPADFARQVARCPLRYVLSDELVTLCVELAFSDGDELCGCLDLVHFPAEQLWIEWDERARRASLSQLLPECAATPESDVARGGVLLSADARGRVAGLRTFWLTRADKPEPMLAALETLLDLDGPVEAAPPAALFDGAAIAVRDGLNPQIDRLLHCARFRLDPAWLRYYRRVAHTSAARAAVLRGSLATVAFDVPMVLALFLLMSLRVALPQLPVRPLRLNVKRARLGKPALLEHIEVSSPVFAHTRPWQRGASPAIRGAPRLHHVRGHIVRRDDTIFWRRAHWRGHLRLGAVRTRTVQLRPPTL